MIRPSIEYASIIYDNFNVTDCMKIEHLQRKTAIICSGANYRTETKLLFEVLNWDSLEGRRKVAKLKLFYMMLRKLTPNYLSDLIKLVPVGRYETRIRNPDQFMVVVQPYSSLSYSRSFIPSSTQLWNKLPESVKKLDTVQKFLAGLKANLNFYPTNVLLNNYHTHGHGKLNKILIQIYLGLSPLRGQSVVI